MHLTPAEADVLAQALAVADAEWTRWAQEAWDASDAGLWATYSALRRRGRALAEKARQEVGRG